MRVLSLFDGISCGRVALERADIPVEVYYASEIDKYATTISAKNFPDIIRLGDVRDVDFTQFTGKIDMVIGGSPCQDLSIAKQNRQGLSGERSGLFWRFVEAIRIIKPKYFLLENVSSMSAADRQMITETLGVEPILINSALVSAQQRKRLYWCNWAVELPEDKKIFLQDILETGEAFREKSHCLDASYFRGASLELNLMHGRRTVVAENVLTAKGCALRSRHNQKQLEVRKDYKSNAITSAMTDSMVCKPVCIGSLGGKSQAMRIYSVKGKSVCLNANGGGLGAKTGLYKIDLPDGDYYVRKLTPIECERLQTLPDNYTEGVSNTQRYKMLGNAWTADVIAHIFSELKKEKSVGFQPTLFSWRISNVSFEISGKF